MNIIANLGINYVFIDGNNGKDSYKDMFLMSQCSHNIIANSSFSWWGAWLNENPNNIVIAPKVWSKKIQKFARNQKVGFYYNNICIFALLCFKFFVNSH